MVEYTSNYNFVLPDFNQSPWHTDLKTTFRKIDTVIAAAALSAESMSPWAVSTAYTAGTVAFDSALGTAWVCQVDHTSASSGTFLADRTANPTYWTQWAASINPRGAWANDTDYALNDIVYHAGLGITAICTTAHTSSSAPDTIDDDSANWSYIVQISASLIAANVANTPAGNIAATTVQAAINELDTEKLALAGGTMTGAIVLSADPAAALQPATKQYVDSLAANLGKRQRVRAATTANIVIATALNDTDTLDGVTLADGDLVLVKDQSAAEENGIYVVGAVPARADEFDTYDEHPGTLITVQEGSINADTVWLCDSNTGGTLDTTAIAFSAIGTFALLDEDNMASDSAAAAPSQQSTKAYIDGLIAANTPIGAQSFWVPVGAMTDDDTAAPAVTTLVGATSGSQIPGRAFDDSADESLWASNIMPKSWGAGTISVYFLWAGDTATSGNCLWGVRGRSFGDDDPDAALGTAVVVSDAPGGAAKDIKLSGAAVVTLTDAAAEELAVFEIYRDADGTGGTDDMTGDAILIGCLFVYTTDQPTDD